MERVLESSVILPGQVAEANPLLGVDFEVEPGVPADRLPNPADADAANQTSEYRVRKFGGIRSAFAVVTAAAAFGGGLVGIGGANIGKNGPIKASSKYDVLPRSTIDRPNDKTGNQIHVFVATCGGGPDNKLDQGYAQKETQAIDNFTSPRMINSVHPRGMVFKWDTYQGMLDVTYLPLPPSIFEPFSQQNLDLSCAHLNSPEMGIVNTLHAISNLVLPQFQKANPNNKNDLNLVILDSPMRDACGWSEHPPTSADIPLLDRTVISTYGDPRCINSEGSFQEAYDTGSLIFALGLPDSSALHKYYPDGGYVTDDSSDLMFVNPSNGESSVFSVPFSSMTLDKNQDDYLHQLESEPFVESATPPTHRIIARLGRLSNGKVAVHGNFIGLGVTCKDGCIVTKADGPPETSIKAVLSSADRKKGIHITGFTGCDTVKPNKVYGQECDIVLNGKDRLVVAKTAYRSTAAAATHKAREKSGHRVKK